MKQELAFLLQIYCHCVIELVSKLAHVKDIKLDILLNLVINFVSNIYIICHTSNIDKVKIKSLLDEGIIIIMDYIIISKEECLATEQYKPKYNDAIHFALQKTLANIYHPSKYKTHHRINKHIYNGVTILRDIFLCIIMYEQKNGILPHQLINNVNTITHNISSKLIPIITSTYKLTYFSSSYINMQLGQLLNSPPVNNTLDCIYSKIEHILRNPAN